MDFARGIAEKITQVVMNYSEVEIKVRESTNDDPWGPSGSAMQELAYQTHRYEGYADVMCMLWRRMLQDNKNNWRRVYKSLVVLAYLLRHGSDKVVMSALEHMYDMKILLNYSCIDDKGKDRGACVRQKVKDVIGLLEDMERLRSERTSAQKNTNKFLGISRELSGNYDSHNDDDDDAGNNNGKQWKSWSSYSEGYRDYNDNEEGDNDDTIKNGEVQRSRMGEVKSRDKKTHVDCSKGQAGHHKEGSDDDDDFDPRKSEAPADDNGFGEFTQYNPGNSSTADKSTSNAPADDMLIFDPLDNKQMMPIFNSSTVNTGNSNSNMLIDIGNRNMMPNVFQGANSSATMSSVPFTIIAQSNLMTHPQLSPTAYQPLTRFPLANQLPQSFPVANHGLYYVPQPMRPNQQQLIFGQSAFQGQMGSGMQNVLHSAATFSGNNGKSLI